MQSVSFDDVKINGGFWADEQTINEQTTVWAVYERFKQSGRFAALNCDWQEGQLYKPHIFWDSDIAKWLEGAAYILAKGSNPQLKNLIDSVVNTIAANQREDGYFNSYFLTVEPDAIFTRRLDHELYCAGHLIEGAIAYYQATGERKLLDCMEKYVVYIDETFRVKKLAQFETPGHQEIELALYRLYKLTENSMYYELLKFFLETRGRSEKDKNVPCSLEYIQSHKPVVQQSEAVGHSVRAIYMYIAMADFAKESNDQQLADTCFTLFENIVNKKMYITGGVGSTYAGEAFTFDYHLPDFSAYAETCASIALAMFAKRLWLMKPDGKYADIAETAIYNTVMAGISLAGDAFFYENPLAADAQAVAYFSARIENERMRLPIIERVKLFDCSCCPPNLIRFIASIGDYLYSYDETTVYAHLYTDSSAAFLINGQTVKINQSTQYPFDGEIVFTFESTGSFDFALRIPSWCDVFSIKVNGCEQTPILRNGYAVLPGPWSEKDRIELSLAMEVKTVTANPAVKDCAGRLAITRGPIVYCAERADNNDKNIRDIRLAPDSTFTISTKVIANRSFPVLTVSGFMCEDCADLYQSEPRDLIKRDVVLIPYFCWANRGANDMSVWLLNK